MKINVMTRFLASPGLLALFLALSLQAEQPEAAPQPPPPPAPPGADAQAFKPDPDRGPDAPGPRGDRPMPPRGGDRGPGGPGSGRGEGDRGPGRGNGDRDRDRDRDRGRGGDWRGMGGFSGRPPMRHDAFDKLPEEDKRRVREALDKVWSRPEVIAAKDKAMRANEEMRDAIRDALAKTDPEAAAILARTEPKDHFDPRELPKLPPPDSPDFPKIMVDRMGMELQSFSRPDRREETRRLHERVMAQPPVQEALAQLKSTEGEARIQAMQNLRTRYREAVGREFQAARERRAAEEKDKDKPDDKKPEASGGL